MHPLLAKLPAAPSSLSPTLRTMLLAASHVALGDAAGTVVTFEHLPQSAHAKAYELSIIQAGPFIGIPRTLHSAAALQAAGIVGTRTEPCTWTSEEVQRRGDDTFAAVYGRHTTRVRGRIGDMSPALETWIVRHVYGALLSRQVQGVTLRERELAASACLAVDAAASVQLASHLRGAMRAGASRDELRAVIDAAAAIGGEAVDVARGVLDSFERARYAI